ncbi:hypothetical protein GUJ93_ZPchr0002g23644 [Zizania palustris]|uniref:Uncharacterized protein n=1 Tax=Zizania palustris TaxID=103762 RepID=A0A8J5VUQ8_ZIZPA|nr:hypothetical protein GUJ93_ZPchr0002g23644 [Zizania palustris]
MQNDAHKMQSCRASTSFTTRRIFRRFRTLLTKLTVAFRALRKTRGLPWPKDHEKKSYADLLGWLQGSGTWLLATIIAARQRPGRRPETALALGSGGFHRHRLARWSHHTEAVLDADEHHEAVDFLREETKNLIQQNGELQRKIMQLQKDIAEMVPLLPRKRKPIHEPVPRPKRIPPHPSTVGPSTASAPAPRPGLVSDPIIENFLEPTVPREPRTRGSESTETASGGE